MIIFPISAAGSRPPLFERGKVRLGGGGKLLRRHTGLAVLLQEGCRGSEAADTDLVVDQQEDLPVRRDR